MHYVLWVSPWNGRDSSKRNPTKLEKLISFYLKKHSFGFFLLISKL